MSRGPFALTFAWILVAPWVFAWYAALAWVALTQVPRNRMTRWLRWSPCCSRSGIPAAARRPAPDGRAPGPPAAESGAGPVVPEHSQARPATRRRTGRTSPPSSPRSAGPRAARRSLAGHRAARGRPGARVLAEPAYRPALFYIDSPRYLFNRRRHRPVGYNGLLRAILAVGNFDTVTLVQHLLGLGMAVAIYVLLRRRGANRWLAALAIAPVLLDGYELQSEQAIMPGTWFQALIVAGLVILLWRPERLAPGRGRRAARRLRPPWPRSARPCCCPRLLFALAAEGGRQRSARPASWARPSPCRSWPTGRLLLLTGGFVLSHAVVTSFYGRTAAAADCATLKLPAAERGLCPSPAQQAQGPDWLEYNQGPRCARTTAAPPRRDRPRAIRLQPPGAGPAAAAGAARLRPRRAQAVRRDPHTSPGDTPIWRWQFKTTTRTTPRTRGGRGPRPDRAVRRRRARRGRRRPVPARLPARRRLHPRPAAGPVHPRRPGRPAGPARRRARRARPEPASSRWPACCSPPRPGRCCWCRTCSSSPGATSCRPWSPWRPPGRWAQRPVPGIAVTRASVSRL